MNNKRVEIDIQTDLFAISPTHGAYIHLSSITHEIMWSKIGTFTIVMHYQNGELQEVSEHRGDKGSYFVEI